MKTADAKPELHVVTALSRVGNLPALLAALAPAAELFDLMWHVVHDCSSGPCRFPYDRRPWLRLSHARVKGSIVGNAQKNKALDAIKGGLVWVLDDDNLPAEGFFEALAEAEQGGADVLLFSQRRQGGAVAEPRPEVGSVDAAQMVARRAAIGDLRFPLGVYASDGHLISRVCAAAGKVAVVSPDRPLTLYNALRRPRA